MEIAKKDAGSPFPSVLSIFCLAYRCLELVSLSRARFLDDKGLRRYIGKHSEVQVPLYKIYNLSVKAATKDGEEVVRLQHFALALIAWKLQEDPPSKMAMDTETSRANADIIGDAELLGALKGATADPGVRIWKRDGFERLPEGCNDEFHERVLCWQLDAAVELLKAFDRGLRLPAIR
ncbi:hypothetical protein RHMOL_Rhmol10G0038200 [Rhododendron molle]|uniref:Uncharacterized protein n=1 Tax=Rhododendron molle TaxID=49168 RepID=A0ACC0LZK6_RHOML|nr:hypothetical protein RHMOL_Rhmol10G0038200 [Rhododendron molle]